MVMMYEILEDFALVLWSIITDDGFISADHGDHLLDY